MENFGERVPHLLCLRVFQRLLLIFLLFNSIFFWLPDAANLFGIDSPFANYYRSSNPILHAVNLLEDARFSKFWFIFFYGQILAAIFLIWKPHSRLVWFVLYFASVTLYNRTAPIQNAGMNLVVILLLLMIFAEPGKELKKGESTWQFALNTMHRFAFFAMKFQVVLLYLVASVIKLTGDTWIDGSAWYYVLFNDTYSNAFWQNYFMDKEWMVNLVSWFTIIFQLSFPVFIWFKKFKNSLLAAGVLFHLLIAISMGIIDFGLIMIVVYVLFLDAGLLKRLALKTGPRGLIFAGE